MREVLEILETDCRVTPEEIATRLDRPVEEVRSTIEALEAEGVIVSHGALINWERAGHGKVFAFISVEATPEHGQGFDGVAEYISRFPEVHSVYLMSGTTDLTVVVQGRDFHEIARFVAERLAPAPGVRATSTSFVLKNYKQEGHILTDSGEDVRLVVSP